jgi:hypothetical protein
MRIASEGAPKRGRPDVCVWLYRRLDQRIAIHPDYEKSAHDRVHIEIVGGKIVPPTTAIRTTQTLDVSNQDQVGFNIKGDFFANDSLSRTLNPGQSCEVFFTKSEITPVRLTCAIHPSLRGWLLVRDDPYFAVSDADGAIAIPKVP